MRFASLTLFKLNISSYLYKTIKDTSHGISWKNTKFRVRSALSANDKICLGFFFFALVCLFLLGYFHLKDGFYKYMLVIFALHIIN